MSRLQSQEATMAIHPTAIIDPQAVIGQNVEIGPYSIIGPRVTIGDGCRIAPHVVMDYTTLGRNCQVGVGAVLGGSPQDINFGGETSYVEVGNDVIIREYVTLNRGTGEGTATQVGDGCMLMAYCHLGHNTVLGNKVIMANSVHLGGYVHIGDNAFIGGGVVLHQFVHIGRLAMIGGNSGARQDIPPFAIADNRPATVIGINKVGLKRQNFTLEQRTRIKKAYHYLFFARLGIQSAIEKIRAEIEPDPNIDELIHFVQNTKRGIASPHYAAGYAKPREESVSDAVIERV
jgi:UDP-N-acetylglucosamine acyltransferase